MAYLNKDGLTHFWEKIKEYISNIKQVDHNFLSCTTTTNGYLRIATFTINETYQGQPIMMTISYTSAEACDLVIEFNNSDSLNPGVRRFYSYEGDTLKVVLSQNTDTLAWDLYVNTTINEDLNIYKFINPNEGIGVTWDGETAISLSSLSSYITYNTKYSDKADKATTLAGYSIEDAYTKEEVDEMVLSDDVPLGAIVGIGDDLEVPDGYIEVDNPVTSDFVKDISISGQTVTVTKGDDTTEELTTQDTTYSAATTSAAGLMSAADKTKLDGIATNANYVTLISQLQNDVAFVTNSTFVANINICRTVNYANYYWGDNRYTCVHIIAGIMGKNASGYKVVNVTMNVAYNWNNNTSVVSYNMFGTSSYFRDIMHTYLGVTINHSVHQLICNRGFSIPNNGIIIKGQFEFVYGYAETGHTDKLVLVAGGYFNSKYQDSSLLSTAYSQGVYEFTGMIDTVST